jgi:hypothetical protein
MDAEQWESMTVNSRSGGEFSERTDSVVGDVTLFARGGAADKLSTVLVEYTGEERLAQSFAFCVVEDA